MAALAVIFWMTAPYGQALAFRATGAGIDDGDIVEHEGCGEGLQRGGRHHRAPNRYPNENKKQSGQQ
jgi:hypothetical protein